MTDRGGPAGHGRAVAVVGAAVAATAVAVLDVVGGAPPVPVGVLALLVAGHVVLTLLVAGAGALVAWLTGVVAGALRRAVRCWLRLLRQPAPDRPRFAPPVHSASVRRSRRWPSYARRRGPPPSAVRAAALV